VRILDENSANNKSIKVWNVT